MKVITVKQPFATLIAEGLKEYEFRTWRTSYRGEILIHAAKSVDQKAMKRFESLGLEYPTGVILAKTTIVDCVYVDDQLVEQLRDKDPLVYYGMINKGNWDGYGFQLENTVKVRPISATGKLSFWSYDGKIVEEKVILK